MKSFTINITFIIYIQILRLSAKTIRRGTSDSAYNLSALSTTASRPALLILRQGWTACPYRDIPCRVDTWRRGMRSWEEPLHPCAPKLVRRTRVSEVQTSYQRRISASFDRCCGRRTRRTLRFPRYLPIGYQRFKPIVTCRVSPTGTCRVSRTRTCQILPTGSR